MHHKERSNFYSGETNKMLRNGFGLYIYENNFFKYEGDWIDGRKHGYGRLLLGDGGYYEGQFNMGEICGKGERFWSTSRNRYCGDFKKGEMHGSGVMSYGNGDIYDGQWDYNLRQGEGKLTKISGEEYDGEFHKNQKHGQGIMRQVDGSVYNGYWICGKKHGDGELVFVDGSIYKGQFNYDNFHGEGTLTHRSGMVYCGIWDQGHLSSMPTHIQLNNVPTECIQGNGFDISASMVDDDGNIAHEESRRLLKMSAGMKYSSPAETNSLFTLIEEMHIQPIDTPFYPIVPVPISAATLYSPDICDDEIKSDEYFNGENEYLGTFLNGIELKETNQDSVFKLTDRGNCEFTNLKIGNIERTFLSDASIIVPEVSRSTNSQFESESATNGSKANQSDVNLTAVHIQRTRFEDLPLPLLGEYVLMIEDVTENPFMNKRMETAFLTIQVLPLRKAESSKSKDGVKQRKSQDMKEKFSPENSDIQSKK